jgi:hypothetical protein
MDNPIPSKTALKAQAKRLRTALGEQGKIISHGQSLEAIAQQYGQRDWNTINAIAPDETPKNQLIWNIGQRVSGRYLGHRFNGQIKAASTTSAGHWRLTILFDEAVDVVESQHFSNLRKQVNCTVGPDGRSARKTSDGQPQIILNS